MQRYENEDKVDQTDSYALRLMSPFRGVLQIVQHTHARALSDDGYNWQIQVNVESRNPIWGELGGGQSQRRDMVFANWTMRDGLQRLPFDPMADVGAACELAEQLVGDLRRVHRDIPFPLRDLLELWSLGADGLPLALLASTQPGRKPAAQTVVSWSAAGPPDTPHELHVSQSQQQLARLVNTAAQTRVWISRGTNDTGYQVAPDSGRVLRNCNPVPDDAFPPLLLSNNWVDAKTAQQVRAYLRQQAARLLTLPNLSDDIRDRLEHDACNLAPAVAHYYRLYPRILNRELIDAARVEARMRSHYAGHSSPSS